MVPRLYMLYRLVRFTWIIRLCPELTLNMIPPSLDSMSYHWDAPIIIAQARGSPAPMPAGKAYDRPGHVDLHHAPVRPPQLGLVG